LGHSVCVIERFAGGSAHSVESLSPGAWPVLDLLGASGRILEQMFIEPKLSLIRWRESEPHRKPQPEGKRGLLIERPRFDTVLLALAEETGAHALRLTRVGSIEGYKHGNWQLEVRNGNRSKAIACRYLIDASGRQGFLGGNRGAGGATRVRFSSATVAVCGWLSDALPPGTTMVEAVADGWIWAAGLKHGLSAAMVFTDPETVRSRKRDGLEAIWREFLAAAGLTPTPGMGPLRLCDATASYHRFPIGEGFLRTGEASYSIDPLSSTGVEKALIGGLTAGTVVHTILRHPDRASMCELFYRTRQQEDVYRHAAWAAGFYREVERFGERPFWMRRARLTVPEPSQVNEAASECSVNPVDEVQLAFSNRLPLRLAAGVRLRREPSVVGDEIAPVLSIISPELQRPVAFLDGIPIGELLCRMVKAGRLDEGFIRARQIPSAHLQRAWAWLIQNRIIEPTSTS
jgi:hypothetical protein